MGLMVSGQGTHRINTATESIIFSTVDEDIRVGNTALRSYHWYFENAISSTQGSYMGSLLHDEYKVLDLDGMLLVQGTFVKGLKVGKWYEWDDAGKLFAIEVYKKGLLDGRSQYFDSGRLIRESSYRRGLQHGWTTEYPESGAETISMRYKKGEIIETDLKPERIKEEKDPSSIWWRELFPKREKDDKKHD
jgi:hypothetical protein